MLFGDLAFVVGLDVGVQRGERGRELLVGEEGGLLALDVFENAARHNVGRKLGFEGAVAYEVDEVVELFGIELEQRG